MFLKEMLEVEKPCQNLRRNRGNFTKQEQLSMDAPEIWGWIPSLQHLCLKRCPWVLWDFVILGCKQLRDESIQGCLGVRVSYSLSHTQPLSLSLSHQIPAREASSQWERWLSTFIYSSSLFLGAPTQKLLIYSEN